MILDSGQNIYLIELERGHEEILCHAEPSKENLNILNTKNLIQDGRPKEPNCSGWKGSHYTLWAEQTRGAGELLGTWSHLEEARIAWAGLAEAKAMGQTQPLLQTPAKAETG